MYAIILVDMVTFILSTIDSMVKIFIKTTRWELVPKPNDGNINDTKWIYKNKIDENGYVYRNKSCIVAQGYT